MVISLSPRPSLGGFSLLGQGAEHIRAAVRLFAWVNSGRVSPWVAATTDASDGVIEWYAYKERKV